MVKLETIKPLLLLLKEECGFLKVQAWKKIKDSSMEMKWQQWSQSHMMIRQRYFIQEQLTVVFMFGKEPHALKLTNYMKAQLWDWPMHQENCYHQDQRILLLKSVKMAKFFNNLKLMDMPNHWIFWMEIYWLQQSLVKSWQ